MGALLRGLWKRRRRFAEQEVRALEMWLSLVLLWWFAWITMVYFYGVGMNDRYYALYILITTSVYWWLYLGLTLALGLVGMCSCWWGDVRIRRNSMFLQSIFWSFHVFLFFTSESLPSVPIFSFAYAAAAAWCYFSLSLEPSRSPAPGVLADPPEFPDDAFPS